MALGGPNAMNGPLVEARKLDGSKDYKAGAPIHLSADHLAEKIDFLNLGEYNSTDWTSTITQAGAGSAVVGVSTTLKNGVLSILNDDASADLVSLQKKSTPYALEAGKQLWMETKIQVDSAVLVDLLVGLVVIDTTPLAHTDGVTFRVTTGSGAISCRTTAVSTTTTTASGVSLVNSTYKTLGIRWDGSSIVEFYVDRVKVATHTTNIPTANLALTIHVQNGSAVARTALVDYILIAKER